MVKEDYIHVKNEDIGGLAYLDESDKEELMKIQESSRGQIRYPSPFNHFIEYVKSGDKYGLVNSKVGNQLLTLFYCDPGLFKKGVLKYSKDLQNAIFSFRESKDKKLSEEYLKIIEGMYQQFKHLVSYVSETGLKPDLLGNNKDLGSLTNDVLRTLNIGSDISRLYADFIGFYIRLSNPNEKRSISKYEALFYKSPEKFVANLKGLNERSREELNKGNERFVKSNKSEFETLKEFLGSICDYGSADLGRGLTSREFNTVANETKRIAKDVIKIYNSLVPKTKEVNGRFKVAFTEQEDYPDAPKKLLESLVRLGYDKNIEFEHTSVGVNKYAYGLLDVARSIIDFSNGNYNVKLDAEFENLERIGKRIGADTVFGMVVVDGEKQPVSYYLSVVYKFLKDKIRAMDFNALSREEDKLEMITEEEYEKLIEGDSNEKRFSNNIKQKSGAGVYVETREPIHTKEKETKKGDRNKQWWASEEGRRVAWNYEE